MKKGRFKVKITIAGIVFVILTIILGVAAINTGNNLLYIIAALMLSIMGLSGFSSFINLINLDFTLELPQEIYAKKKTFLIIKIKNKKQYFPSFLLGIKNSFSISWLTFLPPKKEASIYLWTVFQRRGWQNIPEIFIFSYFPLSFFSRGFKLSFKEKCLVYPKPIVCDFSSMLKDFGHEDVQKKGEEDFKGLRESLNGEYLRHVHWLATARLGKFILKEYEGDGSKKVLLILSNKNDLENQLGRLTYLANLFFKKDYAVGLKTPSIYLPPEKGEKQRKEILKTLALYET
ncbi:MAG: DUF58 domain-containing protein [Candidatus Desulfofervidus auxilii]|nr:DUF58 domain-containing protein [Candidatus Desulfofervidus auxilii]